MRGMRRYGGLSSLGGLVSGTLDDLGLRRHVQEQQAVTKWKEIVGPQIAASSSAQMVRDGILFVSCKSSSWANELALLKPDIMKKLAKALGKNIIKDVRFSASGFKKLQEEVAEESIDIDSILLDDADIQAAERIASSAPPELAEKIKNSILNAKRRAKIEKPAK